MAQRIHNAWLKTLEAGIHTYDIFKEGTSKQKVGTKEFAEAVVANLGKLPETLKSVEYKTLPVLPDPPLPTYNKVDQVGVDIFVNWAKGDANELGQQIEKLGTDKLKLVFISNRGTKVYPGGLADTVKADQWRCRFEGKRAKWTRRDVLALYTSFVEVASPSSSRKACSTTTASAATLSARASKRKCPLLRRGVAVIMGSKSDWETMRHADEMLSFFGVPHECRVVSAHRTPDYMAAYAREAEERGIEVIIAGAGGAAHLPGMVSAFTLIPVLGVPVESHAMKGIDSLYSIVQMPEASR